MNAKPVTDMQFMNLIRGVLGFEPIVAGGSGRREYLAKRAEGGRFRKKEEAGQEHEQESAS